MSASLPFGVSARGASILVVDDEPDVADLFRQSFRREARQGTYVMHFAVSGVGALDRLAGEIQPTLIAVLIDINMPGMGDPPRFTGARINLTYGRRSSAVVPISRLRAGRGSRGRDQSFVRPFKARGAGRSSTWICWD